MDDPDLGGLLGGDEHYAILRPNRIGLAPLHVDDPKNWPGRAAGLFQQPVINGWLLALGLAIAMLLLSRRSEPTWRRWLAFVVAIACGYGIYLTHTRDAWLSGVVVLIIGALMARGYRKGFIVAICLVASVVAVNWSVFTSSDRKAGGVGQIGEFRIGSTPIRRRSGRSPRNPSPAGASAGSTK